MGQGMLVVNPAGKIEEIGSVVQLGDCSSQCFEGQTSPICKPFPRCRSAVVFWLGFSLIFVVLDPTQTNQITWYILICFVIGTGTGLAPLLSFWKPSRRPSGDSRGDCRKDIMEYWGLRPQYSVICLPGIPQRFPRWPPRRPPKA
jgi:hypothetical protein